MSIITCGRIINISVSIIGLCRVSYIFARLKKVVSSVEEKLRTRGRAIIIPSNFTVQIVRIRYILNFAKFYF